MDSKVKGYAGKYLWVNLTDGILEDIKYEEEIMRKYLGGTGIGAKVLYDHVPRNIEFDDPENIISVCSGPLGGTIIGGSGTISIVTKGALTGGATSVQANGLFGAYMKFSGYDGVFITGSSDKWKYLVLKEGKAELADATNLQGLDTYEVTDTLRNIHGVKGRDASVISIGPAGEKKVRWAGVFMDHGHSASHNGPGAVMGSKKLKAIIAFKGDARLDVHDNQRLVKVAQDMYQDVSYFTGTIGSVERMYKGGSGALPIKNYDTYDWNINEDIEKFGEPYIRENYQKDRMQCWS
ncbi:hypothetical protein GF319_12250, partial [Candidatus Bathyarchaeota archaeon]|nr:hypothetical protein [Candidatus Bathyarchaeota archaeon]